MGKWVAELLRRAVKNSGAELERLPPVYGDERMCNASIDGKKIHDQGLVKGALDDRESDTVVELVKEIRHQKMEPCARQLNGRLGKQCRER
jgi:hypothetical protein